jgi:N-acetylmuramoyl-L-alanine amidase
METREADEVDVDTLLRAPEESGDYDCSVPKEYAGDPDEEPDAVKAPPQPIKARCSREFRAAHDSGTRSTSQIGLIVIHCTESTSARSSAQWFANPDSRGSAHVVADGIECYRTLEDNQIPWAAPGANTRGFHIEIAGFARWSEQVWLQREKALRRAAFKAAFHADKFGVPVKLLTVDQLKTGKRGLVTHHLCTKAFGGDHTDPGANFPMDRFLAWTREFVGELD